MGCENCKEIGASGAAAVPYIVYESSGARFERTLKRIVIALVVTVVLLFASNVVWLWAWTRYDYSSEETVYTQDGQGLNIIGDRNIAGVYDGTDGTD